MAPEDVFLFVYDKGEARYTDLTGAFVKSKKCATQTFINYKKQLEAAGKLRKRISEITNRPVYYVPEEFKEEAQVLMERKNLTEQIKNASLDELDSLKIINDLLASDNKKLKEELYNLKERVRTYILLHGT